MRVNTKQWGMILIEMLVVGILTVGTASNSHALTIGMPNRNWITQYGIGMCSAVYNSNNYMTWQQVQAAPKNSINVGTNEVICVVGHGTAGNIGGVAALVIAQTITDKVNHVRGNDNVILLIACFSAVQPEQGQSVMQAFQAIGGNWQGNRIVGCLGLSVANRNGNGPLFRTVLQNPLSCLGSCSQGNLTAQQNNLQGNVQVNINNCRQTNVGDLAIGQCMYNLNNPDGQAINSNFYTPFLNYITTNQCDQVPGVVEGNM